MFKDDYEKAKTFTAELLPILRDALKATEIVSFEDLDNESLPNLFDQHAGIDAVSIDRRGMRGIALRVQYDTAWDTFTIRTKRASGTKTELAKRIEAIQKGYIYPYLTCQCYCDRNHKLLSGAVCRTEDLYKYIVEHEEELGNKARHCPEGNEFYWVGFDTIEEQCKLLRLKSFSSQPPDRRFFVDTETRKQ